MRPRDSPTSAERQLFAQYAPGEQRAEEVVHAARVLESLDSTPEKKTEKKRLRLDRAHLDLGDDDSDETTEVASPDRLRRTVVADGVQLHLAHNLTGYRGVYQSGHRFKAVHACRIHGKVTNIGTFSTAVEAAICYAKYVESLGVAVDVFPGRVTEAEGLLLHLSEESKSKRGNTGYLGVSTRSCGRFRAQYRRGGKIANLGTFATPLEAAICYAKYVQSLSGSESPGTRGGSAV